VSRDSGRSRTGNEQHVTHFPAKRHLHIVKEELGDAAFVGGAMSLAPEECSDDRPGAEPPGERLRRAREAHGLTVEDLARITKISKASLTAIESSDVRRLPADIYTRGFVKAYAREVGLDPEITAEQYLGDIDPLRAPQASEAASQHSPGHPTATEDGHDEPRHLLDADQFHRVGWLATGLALTGLIVYLVSFGGDAGGRNAAGVRPADPVGSDAVAANQVTPDTGALAPDAATAAGGPLQVDLSTQGLCWLVISIDGEPVLARLLQPGEHHTFDVDEEAVLRVGDPGALTMSINGQAARPLGAAGEPVDVRITKANFHQFLRS
jgi:transcriptional regulator with XRE-family HTH domain